MSVHAAIRYTHNPVLELRTPKYSKYLQGQLDRSAKEVVRYLRVLLKFCHSVYLVRDLALLSHFFCKKLRFSNGNFHTFYGIFYLELEYGLWL